MDKVQTWVDGFGRWHASVPLSSSRARDAATARRAIQAELMERYAPNYDPRTLHVTRWNVTAHGTVHYGER